MPKKLTQEEFETRIIKKFKGEFTVLGKYNGSYKKVLVRHNICNHKWEVIPGKIISGTCPKCANKIQYTTEEYKQMVKEVTDDKYEVLSEYFNAVKKVTIRHKICGYTWDIIPRYITSRGAQCPRCQKRERYTTKSFADLIENTTDGEYKLQSKYKNMQHDICVKHVNCGHVFEIAPTQFLYYESGCPLCKDNMSKGEKKIYKYLVKNNIKFKTQYTFTNCKYKSLLKFDFAIFDETKLVGIVEFDGKQHYEPIGFFGGEKGFKELQKRDQIKNKYCKNNNIPILRIPYWEKDNIVNLLEKSLIDEFNIKLNLKRKHTKLNTENLLREKHII